MKCKHCNKPLSFKQDIVLLDRNVIIHKECYRGYLESKPKVQQQRKWVEVQRRRLMNKPYKIKVAGVWCEEIYIRWESGDVGKGYATLDLHTFARDGIVQEVICVEEVGYV